MVRYRIFDDENCCLFLLDMLSAFLEDNLAIIRKQGAARYDAQKLIKLVQAEVEGTQLKQQAFQALDGHIFLMALIAQAGHHDNNFMLRILPR